MKARELRIPIMMSKEEVDAVDDWRFANRVATRSGAIRQLVSLGLANISASGPSTTNDNGQDYCDSNN